MESGNVHQPSSTSHHTQATSSSVIVQSNQPEDVSVLTSLSDIQLRQEHSSATISANVTSISSGAYTKLHQSQQASAAPSSCVPGRISSSIQQASSSSASSPILSPQGKTIGRNNNGTSK